MPVLLLAFLAELQWSVSFPGGCAVFVFLAQKGVFWCVWKMGHTNLARLKWAGSFSTC